MNGRQVTAAEIQEWRALHARGVSFESIGRRYGRADITVRRHCLGDAVAAHKAASAKTAGQPQCTPQARAAARDGALARQADRKTKVAMARELRFTDDTRDLTATVFGDPRPGRSALDRVRAGDSVDDGRRPYLG
jgi:hypothetical protein